MWFGLIPGPYRVVRAFVPRNRTYSRSCARRPVDTDDTTSLRAKLLGGLLLLAAAGCIMLMGSANLVQPGQMPPGVNAPYGWYTDTDGYLEPVTGVNVPPVIYPKEKDSNAPLGNKLLIAAGIGLLLLALSWKWLREDPDPYYPPTTPPDFPPGEQMPSPPPDYPPSGPRSGHKPVPVNRERPMDRPHPWRTWEG